MSICAKEVNEYLCAIKQGDKAKFKQLFELISRRILGVARYYLVDKSYCEDVVSEVFQKVYLYIDSYDESKDGYNWICRIAENTAYDFNFKSSQNSDNTDPVPALPESELLEDAEKRVDLFRAIDKLDPESRELINLHYFLGDSYSEIGKKFHISKVAVKKKIDKILSKLKIYIENKL
ncbi:MAG: RNA polymerase sigma factor [Clostridiales bacterium]|nr:RNA polymerase sigma factor [Clostridiales bacterium]